MPVWPLARKSAAMPRAAKARVMRQRGVLLAQRAVGAHGQQALAAAPLAAGERNARRRAPHVDQAPAQARGGGAQHGNAVEPGVHAADDVQARFQRQLQVGDPAFGNEAAGIGHADHQRARAGGVRFGRRQAAQAGADRGAAAGEFAHAAFAGPVAQAEGGLGVAGLGGVAQDTAGRAAAGRQPRAGGRGIAGAWRALRRVRSRASGPAGGRGWGPAGRTATQGERGIRSGSRTRSRWCAAGSAWRRGTESRR